MVSQIHQFSSQCNSRVEHPSNGGTGGFDPIPHIVSLVLTGSGSKLDRKVVKGSPVGWWVGWKTTLQKYWGSQTQPTSRMGFEDYWCLLLWEMAHSWWFLVSALGRQWQIMTDLSFTPWYRHWCCPCTNRLSFLWGRFQHQRQDRVCGGSP